MDRSDAVAALRCNQTVFPFIYSIIIPILRAFYHFALLRFPYQP